MRGPEQKFEAMVPSGEGKETPKDDKSPTGQASEQPTTESEVEKGTTRSPEEPYIVIGENSVSYLGVEVPKGQGGRLVPKAEEFKEEYFYLEGHYTTMREVATALLLNKPFLLEGGTGVYNKTTTIARMCRDLNMNYCKVNFDRETVREDVIGGHTLKIDENGKEKLEWYDGDLMYAIRNGGVAFLDEYNRQSKIAGIINPIMDAILNGRKEITNPYNENERVTVHPDFRLVAAQNPPGFEEGHEYADRSQLPAETFGRWIFRKLPIEYFEEEQNKLLAGVIGEKVDINLPESEFRHSGEGLPVRELAEIPGMTHWRKEIINIVRVLEAKSSGAKREMAKNQRQNLYFNPRLIMSTIPQYIARFYRGDINETVKNAFETCITGMYSSETDKQRIRLMLDQASWKPPVAASKRRGAERSTKESESSLSPEQVAAILERNRDWQQEMFGQTFEMPPLPGVVTPERLKHWESLKYELLFFPRLTLKETDTYPGWKKKPGKRHTPGEQYGLEFFDELQKIQDIPENASNPNLSGLAPNELPGDWMLMDTRAKPNYDAGQQSYEDDQSMSELLQRLAAMKDARGQPILNAEAKDGRRSKIHPAVFQKPEFWSEIKKLFQLEGESGVTFRLPRVIEQNVTGQALGWDGTTTYEWAEEYYQSGLRLISGSSGSGGASYVYWRDEPSGLVGFRPLVVFSHQVGSLESWPLGLWERKVTELRERESKILSSFFEKPITVPPLPAEITPARLENWAKLGLEIHYLPAENMTKDRKLKAWKKKPEDMFYDQIAAGEIPSSAVQLPAGWLVIDGRQKPAYADGKQMYDLDPLAPALADLHRRGVIKQSNYDGTALDPQTRFGLKPEDFDKPEVIKALAKAMDLDPAQFSLSETIVWNVLANIHHPKWGTTNTAEWQKEKTASGRRLISGSSDYGGASDVDWRGEPSDDVGFRPLGRFSP